MSDAVDDIITEAARQFLLEKEGKFPYTTFTHVDECIKYPILAEECGEIARNINEAVIATANGIPSMREYMQKQRTELVQVAAVALNWIHSLDEREPILTVDEGTPG